MVCACVSVCMCVENVKKSKLKLSVANSFFFQTNLTALVFSVRYVTDFVLKR